MTAHPLVSIIIPAFNGEAFISQAVSSALNQTYDNLEIIVIDDASHDRTCDAVRQFQDHRLRLIENEHNIGLTANLNKGICSSSGEYICWLNQDDIFYAHKIEKQLHLMVPNPQVGACFCAKDDIDKDGKALDRFNASKVVIPLQDQLVQLFGGCYLAAPTVMMQRKTYHRSGGFDPTFSVALDYDMWFKIKKFSEIRVINIPLLAFRHHEGNLSSEKNEKIVAAECASVVRKNLDAYSIEEIYPFLTQINDPEQERIEKSACLFSLADLIWRQKKWNLLLADDVLVLIQKALAKNPLLLEAYALGLEVCPESSKKDQHHLLSDKYDAARMIYKKLRHQLQVAFEMGHQKFVSDILQKMYALNPLNGDPYYQLARLFHASGDAAQAQFYCEHAIKLNNHHPNARKLMPMIQVRNDSHGPGVAF